MTERSRVVLLRFGGSVVAHVCVFALLANVHWSAIATQVGDAASAGSLTAEHVRGLPAAAESEDQPTAGATARAIAAMHVVKPLVHQREGWAARVAAHVWESTLVAAIVGLLTLLLRRSGAHVRYWLWLGASMKFFLPFSSIVSLGGGVGWLMRTSHVPAAALGTSIVELVQSPETVSEGVLRIASPVPDSAIDGLVFAVVSAWLLGALVIGSMRYVMWRRVRATLRVSSPLTIRGVDLPADVQLRSGCGALEPGVIGWRRPVLLLPRGIESQLTAPELQAVIAHEVCHIRRRDNFTAALHMLTETAFWFHPVVWWIGGRLVAERERACDEAVLAVGHEPAIYARAIVNTCAMYVAAPIACVSGVTGSDLTARIETIVRNECPVAVSTWRKAVLASTVIGMLTVPLGYGILRAAPRTGAAPPDDTPRMQANSALTFDAASVKVNNSGLDQALDRVEPGRYAATNMPLAVLIRFAYAPPRSRSLEPFEISGGPGWLLSDRFDIHATAGRDVSLPELRAMLRTLLAERFQLRAHFEQRDGSVYRMSLARAGRLGPQLRPAKADCAAVPFDPLRGFVPGDEPTCGYFGPSPEAPLDSNRAYQAMRGMQMQGFAGAHYPYLGRRVVDMTGLTGYFDGEFEFTAEIVMPPPPSGVNPFDGRTLPSIFSVLPQQLGLKLESGRGPVDILIVDHAERPTPN
jgi:uncharacterized protein (TIGR03435 family)